jgi:hypothetical protein
MSESNYQYTFEAEKNDDTEPGFKSFATVKEALDYLEEGGILRATCNPSVRDRVRTRTVYMLSEKIAGLSEQEVLQQLDQEVEKSLIESMEVNYGNLKELSVADLIALEGWFERLENYWSGLSDKSSDSLQGKEEYRKQFEICSVMRTGISQEISGRITNVFPDFEYSPDKGFSGAE